MTRKLITVGNSIAVSIPRKYLKVLNVEQDKEIELTLQNKNKIAITKIK